MSKMAVLPTQAEVIQLRQIAPNSLESTAIQINRYIGLALRADANADSYRLSAGRELIRVRPKVEAAGHGWEAWCAENIRRSMRDIRKLMRMAGANDPETALEDERENRRQSMRAYRSHVGPVEQVFIAFLKLTHEQRIELMALVRKEMES
jgi:hypothetical protein